MGFCSPTYLITIEKNWTPKMLQLERIFFKNYGQNLEL